MMTVLIPMTTKTMATTDRRRPASARGRIIRWLLGLSSLAVVALVVITANVLFIGANARLQAELVHEGDKLRAFAAEPNPDTGAPFTDTRALLTAFLRSNMPEQRETLFSIIDGVADRRSSPTPLARLDQDLSFIAMAALAASPSSGIAHTSAGDAYYALFPVRVAGDPQQGVLVVVEFAAPAYADVWATVRTLIVVGLGALIASGIGSWLVAGRVLAPISAVRRTAELISETDLGRRIEVSGRDDVAELALTFNRMLDRIEVAFTTQRRFLDDASHELRTPITVVRGHLEVMGTDPRDQSETRELVLDELDRMNRIVDDLMVLARAERPDFVIPGVVDLTDLVVETLSKARTLGSRQWVIDGVAEATITGDAQRLTQALMQLLSNAVAHTSIGDRISVGSRIDSTRAVLWVTDSGTGIEASDQARIFDRFFRGRGGSDRQGAGLGLAIVQTIAALHGGKVSVTSELGAGATFTIALPLTEGQWSGLVPVTEPPDGQSEAARP